jgi:hypothetical protein
MCFSTHCQKATRSYYLNEALHRSDGPFLPLYLEPRGEASDKALDIYHQDLVVSFRPDGSIPEEDVFGQCRASLGSHQPVAEIPPTDHALQPTLQ